jgi:hypothetical protein
MDDELIEGRRSVPKNAPKAREEAFSAGGPGKFDPFNIAEAKKRGLPLPPPFPKSAKTVVEVSPG